jgi:hypothetical protein
MPALITELLPELRAAKGWSAARLSEATAPFKYVQPKTIESLENPSNAGRVSEAWIYESLAAALGEEPSVFYEWPLAVARRDRPSTPAEIAAARDRMRARLREKAEQRNARPEAAPDTKPARRRPKGEAS